MISISLPDNFARLYEHMFSPSHSLLKTIEKYRRCSYNASEAMVSSNDTQVTISITGLSSSLLYPFLGMTSANCVWWNILQDLLMKLHRALFSCSWGCYTINNHVMFYIVLLCRNMRVDLSIQNSYLVS